MVNIPLLIYGEYPRNIVLEHFLIIMFQLSLWSGLPDLNKVEKFVLVSVNGDEELANKIILKVCSPRLGMASLTK